AIRTGQVQELHGFGNKIQNQILEAIVTRRRKKLRHPRSAVRPQAEALTAYIKNFRFVQQVEIAGSYRRGKDTVGDIDILVCTQKPKQVVNHFMVYPEIARITSKGGTRASVVLTSGLNVDLRVVERSSFGSALQYFTGSKAHSIRIRRLAQGKDLKINEYGVFHEARKVAGRTEASVYRAVGLPLIPPELREARGEIGAARERRLPTLVELNDLQGDLHVHTAASDGHADILRMAIAAKKRNLQYIAITDHSKHLTIAHGLNEKQLYEQIEEIDKANEKIKGLKILKGIEVDILEDGSLDLPDHVLAKLDLVLGAIHDHFHLSREQQTERILRAMDSRYFSILAHPTGRLLKRRDPYAVDVSRVVEQARVRGCFLELNSQPQRLDLSDEDCRLARDQGVLIAINSDAHFPDDFTHLAEGILQGRRGWLAKDDVLNARPLAELLPLLRTTMFSN
ncbi:MAG: DNA polymerase/3'-5' exonuclease PolX, partial [Gammaproteobacteria bacterium]|nr:DNA polymerase/3'-5' exonuclease PolX [Gammaproteobacteria bacterium]